MNKYQESLDRLSPSDSREEEIKDTMQELIDNYKSLREDYMSYQDLKNEYEQEIEKLEKALDKVCLYLAVEKPNKSYEEWKEYLLKESEKQ